ncbi:MAG: DNA primase [Bacteroidales bacterium]|nr:DNA primase [Candidatus Cryptobacteroides choladohippi]
MIPQETVNLILDTAQIADVVSDYVTLRRRGANLVACCPFHNEKTPSFYVSPAKGIYKCFGCGKSGTAVGFVMEQEHCTYAEALRYLARRYNIEIQEREETPEEISRRQHSESLLLVSEFAQKFYASQLSQPGEGRSIGLSYYRSRGIEDATIARFGLGWAPRGRTALIEAAAAAGYRTEYLIDAGLAVAREDGTVVDKFHERVMFPIHSVSGRVVAFSGRTLHADNPAKYVNSPETEIYVKSRNLLGIYFAKSEISRLDKCILVEGNVDMVMMHQLGITNVVASCGTSLTMEQIRLIHKFTQNITIMYDGDSAGIHAALRGIDMILAEGMNVKIVLLPDGEDPDSFSRSHTLDQVQAFISEGEKDFVMFKTELLLDEAAGDPLKKANLINDIADTISKIPDPVKRSTYVEATSQKFGIEAQILFDRISKERRAPAGPERAPQVQVQPAETPVWEPENRTLALAEQDLLSFLLTNGCNPLEFESDSQYYLGDSVPRASVADFIRDALEGDGTSFANSVYRRAYDAYMQMYDEGLVQEDIVRRLLDSPDRVMADVCASLSSQKYRLTVSAFENALTTTASWLVVQVPKAILIYNERRLHDRIDGIRRSLKTASEQEQLELMQQLVKLQTAQRRIRQMAGREKTL